MTFVETVKRFFGQYTTQKVLTVLGASFLMAPMNISYVWGNLSTYVMSYIRRYSPSVSGSQATWVPSLYLILEGVTIFPAAYLIRFVGKWTTALIGVILLSISGFSTYFAIDQSIALVDFTQGALYGVGAGLLMASSTKYGVEWSDAKSTGTVLAIIYNSYSVTAIIVNEFITWCINPRNKLPDILAKDGNADYAYFSKTDVLARVPGIFLALSTFYLALQIVGLLMVRDAPSNLPPTVAHATGDKEKSKEANEETSLKKTTDGFDSIKKDQPPSSALSSSSSLSSPPPSPTSISSLSSSASSESKTVTTGNGGAHDISPRQLVCKPSFYFLWIAFFTNEVTFIVVSAVYKAFGQLWIDDDFFLTGIGTAVSAVIVAVKFLTGISMDKIGHKPVLMFYYGAMTVCGGFMYLAPRVSKWLYGLLVILEVPVSGSGFLLHSVAVVKLYGQKYAVENVAVLSFASIIVLFVIPLALAFLMNIGGWAAVFCTCASLNAIGFIAITFGIPGSHV